MAREMKVSGEIRTLAWREGSSGIFSGSIEGLYQGYRFGSTTPDERRLNVDAPNGSIALVLRQEISTFLPPRPKDHPFADGKDPLAGPPPGGPPPNAPRGGPGAHGQGPAPGMDPSQRPFFMKVSLRIDPEKSTGIFAGATGETELSTPHYRMAGYLVVNTAQGDLRLNFLEHEQPEAGNLVADLQVDGGESTGIYRGARGDLTFSIVVAAAANRPNYGKGTYAGTIWLQ